MSSTFVHMDIGNKLKLLRTKLNFSQSAFAKVLGVGDKTYWNYENNVREIPAKCLSQLVAFYRLNLNWLFCDEGDMIQSEANIYDIGKTMQESGCYAIPVRGEVEASCGFGCEVYNESKTAVCNVSRKFLDDFGISPSASEIIFARGDSMEPTILAGDNLLVDTSKRDVYDGTIYCINLNGQLYVKRLQKLSATKLAIVSDNPKYKTIEFDAKNEADTLVIIGEVRYIGRMVPR